MSNSLDEERADEQEFQAPSSHHPSAPPHELFDISTTVDPSYVISLMRKLLPCEEAIRSAPIHDEPKTEIRKEGAINLPENGADVEAMESSGNNADLDKSKTRDDDQNRGGSEVEKTWEECGCVLWDLSASEDHAQFMVQNLILDVLLANLEVCHSSRITEISLGILGNLACHDISRKQMSSKKGLVRMIVEQLLSDDVPCLGEVCREGVIWAEELQDEQILPRILWIAENALNPQLLEKIVGLLLAVLESQQEISAILIPCMLDLGLTSLLIKLLAFEMSTLKGEQIPDRYTVLDSVLRAIEALSTMDDLSQEVCLNKELMQLVKELIEYPDKFEVASSCVTAAVLIANILTDANHFASELSQDLNFLQGLIDVFPFASNDTEAQNAIWSTVARLLMSIKEDEMGRSNFRFLVSIIASKLDFMEDELLVRPLNRGENQSARVIAMKRIFDILTRWKLSDNSLKDTSFVEDDHRINEEDVGKLLELLQ